MKHFLAIPVMAFFTACASTQPPETPSDIKSATTEPIPQIANRSAAQYVGVTVRNFEYSLKNSWPGKGPYKENIRLATFLNEDRTSFSLTCADLDNRISKGIIALQDPKISFTESIQIKKQEFHYTLGLTELRCPVLEA